MTNWALSPKRFGNTTKVTFEFQAKIGSQNNNGCSLAIESNDLNLVVFGNCLYYYKNGWQLVDLVPLDLWNNYKIAITPTLLEIYINNELKYSQLGIFSVKSFLAFRDYGLCSGQVVNYLDNIKVTNYNSDDYSFTGKKMDQETGLVYFGGRFYDPEVGRFISVDPARDGINWYEYCRDNPVNLVDPNGKETKSISFCHIYSKTLFGWSAASDDNCSGSFMSPTAAACTAYVSGTITVTTTNVGVSVTGNINVGVFTDTKDAGVAFTANVSLTTSVSTGRINNSFSSLDSSGYSLGTVSSYLGSAEAGIGSPTCPWSNGFVSGTISKDFMSMAAKNPTTVTITTTFSFVGLDFDFTSCYGMGIDTESVSVSVNTSKSTESGDKGDHSGDKGDYSGNKGDHSSDEK